MVRRRDTAKTTIKAGCNESNTGDTIYLRSLHFVLTDPSGFLRMGTKMSLPNCILAREPDLPVRIRLR
jgi:hypothetical protein